MIQPQISEIPLGFAPAEPFRIATPHGTMKCSSLRRGDWIVAAERTMPILVTINSAKLKRCCLRWDGISSEASWCHESLSAGGFRFVGHGKLRRWLPSFLHRWISPYSLP